MLQNIYPDQLIPNDKSTIGNARDIKIGDQVILVLAGSQRPVTSTVEMIVDLFGSPTYTSRATAGRTRFRFRPQDVHHVEPSRNAVRMAAA
ncbi:hypothetical protein [Kerstersia gyiorum]|uniref:hypothetical protein n=1 Tax=Kerstersia gyiorum TaxID=206506 RepID=UPI000A0643E9|nr:hypothetical protein [Kerstersia gyiorum]